MKNDKLSDARDAAAAADAGLSASSNALQFSDNKGSITAVTVPSQRDRRSMSRRSGQKGSVTIVGMNYVGRYRADESGSTKRIRKAVTISSVQKMTKPQAERWLARFIEGNGINDAMHLERSRTPVLTFGQAASTWKDHLNANKKPSSQRSMACELRNHILPLVESTPMEELDYRTVRGLIAGWQKKGLSTKSIKNLFGIVRAVYNFQLDETARRGKTTLPPWIIKWKKVKPVADIEQKVPYFEEEQMVAIVHKAKDQREVALYALAGGSGLRASELFGLRCEDVNLAVEDGTGVVTVRRGVFEGREYTTKSNKVRHVPIDATVVAQLKRHLGSRRSGYVSQTRDGRPLRESNVIRVLHKVLKQLKIPRAGLHAFRHGRCSFLVRSDVSRAVIREWLGHGSDAMVDRYCHHLGKYGRREMQRLTPLLDSTWTQHRKEEADGAVQAVVN
jgi:integrase